MDAAPVDAVAVDGLLCWVSQVGRREFGEQLSQRMEDLEWLAAATVRHQNVVASIARHGEILPARFGTVFLNPASLHSDIKRNQRAILAGLRRVAGAEEWGVKVFVASTGRGGLVARSGREYLQKKAQTITVRRVQRTNPELMALSAALMRVSVASATGGKVSSGQPRLLWQGSFLVRRNRKGAFDSVLKQFARRWQGRFRIESSGPWPPYSFASSHGKQSA